MGTTTKYKVGYIDEDPGWRIIVRSYLKDDFDIVLLDINQDSTIEGLVEAIKTEDLDAIIIDFRLNETGMVAFNGNDIIEAILKQQPYFPIMMLTSHEQEAIDQVDNVNIINGKDMLENPRYNKAHIIIAKINSNINRHIDKKIFTENRLKELSLKRVESLLTLPEEEEYTKLYGEWNELYPENKIIPSHLATPDSITQLNEMVKSTREILDELKKKQ